MAESSAADQRMASAPFRALQQGKTRKSTCKVNPPNNVVRDPALTVGLRRLGFRYSTSFGVGSTCQCESG